MNRKVGYCLPLPAYAKTRGGWCRSGAWRPFCFPGLHGVLQETDLPISSHCCFVSSSRMNYAANKHLFLTMLLWNAVTFTSDTEMSGRLTVDLRHRCLYATVYMQMTWPQMNSGQQENSGGHICRRSVFSKGSWKDLGRHNRAILLPISGCVGVQARAFSDRIAKSPIQAKLRPYLF